MMLWRGIWGSRQAQIGLVLLGLFAAIAAFGPLLTRDPAAFLAAPLRPPSAEFWLGTTRQGQDAFAQLIVGTKTSLGIGLLVGVLVMSIGTIVGLTAAYFGGLVDDALSLVVGVFLILPGLPLAVLLAAFLEAGPLTIAAVLVLTGWAWNARVVRAQALSLRHRDYILSAIALGEHPLRIMLVEMLPNMTSIVFSSFIAATMHAIGAQVGLEFLGLGDVSQVTWGTNLFWAVTNQDILTESWWTMLPTGLAIALFGFALAQVNYGIDEVTSPKLKVDRAYTALVGHRTGLRRLLTPVFPETDDADREADQEAPLLSIRNLSVDYVGNKAVRAVDDLSLDIRRGEIFGLLGESGSGKSTAILAALRLLPPPAVIRSGRVLFDGVDLLTLDEAALRRLRFRRIAVVLQSAMNALSPVLSIREQISDVILAHEGGARGDAWARAADLLELVGIEPKRLQSYPHELSGGMRQRVAIAMALALRPALLVLDEPTTALDVVVEREILQKLAELAQALGFSMLLVSHDVSAMLEFCDRLGVLYAGRVCELAPRADLERGARHPYTRGLLDSVPSLHQERTRLVGIPGAPPDIARPPSGCRFHPRCAHRVDLCERAVPPLLAAEAGRGLACHRPLQLGRAPIAAPPRRTS